MRFENMMLRDIKAAKAERTPIVIPVGTIEYHGPHCSLGCDTQICLGLLSELEKRKNIIIAPPVWYGVASFAVGGPENGTVNVDVDIFEAYIYQIFTC
jgi:creatinine amidohydrolase/Fe(II)-dependent formamide hydrolase-like protein